MGLTVVHLARRLGRHTIGIYIGNYWIVQRDNSIEYHLNIYHQVHSTLTTLSTSRLVHILLLSQDSSFHVVLR
jgi:hypothetical protein